MVSINSAITFAMVPEIPFGGVRDSGFGRIHGEDGLREFAWPRGITTQRFSPPIKVTTFDRKPSAVKLTKRLVKLRWGRVTDARRAPVTGSTTWIDRAYRRRHVHGT